MIVTNTGPELAYMRIVDAITARIGTGDLAPGDKLPPERDLAAEFEVSYPTVRRATEVLRDRGLIETVHGKGTFVSRR